MRIHKTLIALAAIALCGVIPLGAQTPSVTIEAESMTLSSYAVENGTRIRLTANTGSATKSFAGQTGTYDIQVHVQPETDGRSTLAVYKGSASAPLQTYTYPLTNSASSFTIKNVALTQGEAIKLVGTLNLGAVARVDKLVFTRVAATAPDAGAPGTGTPGASTPYSGTPITLPKAFPAVEFDRGGQGVAYKDNTTGNAGKLFRTSEDVDIKASADTAGGPYAVNSFQTGEWLAYTVNVPADGTYDLAIRAAHNQSTNPTFHMEVDGRNVTGTLSVPRTGGWGTYQWVGKPGVPLTAGKHVIKVVSEQQYFDMSAVSVLAGSASAPAPAPGYAGTPYSGTPVALPRIFPAVEFDKGGQGVAYKDNTTGNAGKLFRTSEDVDIKASADAAGGPYAVNSFQTGEWLAYTVNVPANGNYDLGIRAAHNQSTNPTFHIEVDGKDVTGALSVPRTGGWGTYQWVAKQGVPLAAGKRVVKVVSRQQYFDVSAVGAVATGTSAPAPVNGAPTVSLTAPSSGQTVSGSISYAATASDDKAVTKVEFSVASTTPMTLGTKTALPYSGTLDTTKLENGAHTLTAVAYDADGKTATSQVSFNVQNGTGGTAPGSTTRPASLLFWSGFEGNVSIGAPRDCYTMGCWQDILGSDSATGFSWPTRIKGGSSEFQVRSGTASTPANITDYIVNQIQTVPGRTGAATRAQYSLIKKNPCTGTGSQASTTCWTQDVYMVRPGSEPTDMYISFWRKLQPDLLDKLKSSWHVVFEWKSRGDYRVIAQLVNYGGVAPYWQIRGDNVANGGHPTKEFWRVENRNVPVPIGQWFKFEVFWHRSKGSDGRVWMAVNGQKIVDRFGPNIGVNSDPIDRIMFMQLYSGASYPLSQWTDDVQIWSTFPSAKPGDPWYDGVYGPH